MNTLYFRSKGFG